MEAVEYAGSCGWQASPLLLGRGRLVRGVTAGEHGYALPRCHRVGDGISALRLASARRARTAMRLSMRFGLRFFLPGARGPAGGADDSVALGLAVLVGDPGVHHVALDDRVHRGLLGGGWVPMPEDAAKRAGCGSD